jgi:hypothetical protein
LSRTKGEGERVVTIAELLGAKQKLEAKEKEYKKQVAKAKQQKKDYLGRHEREELMVLAAIASKLEEFIENWYKYQRPRKRITYIKTALTYVYKTMDAYFDGLTEAEKTQQVYRILRDLKACNIYLQRGREV